MTSSVLTDFEFAPFDIIDGDRGKNYPKQNEFASEGHCLFLSATNVTKRGFDFSDCQFISEQKDAALRKGKLRRGDVVLTTRGTIGNSAYYSDVIQYDHMRINSGMVILRCDTENILPVYLYHFLRSPSFSGQVNSLRSGVAQPQLPIRDMKKIKLPLPSVKVQSQISSVLSAYDDLIENNRRRIQLLEQAARLLYKEWFVHLRFPGHEHTQIIDGVPEGWPRRELSDLTSKIGSGATPRGGAAGYQATGITLVRSQNIYDFQFVDNGLAYIDDLQAKKLANVTVEERDILLNITGASVGRCCMIPNRHLPSRVNQHVMIIRVKPSRCGPHYILHSINSHRNKEQLLNIARAGGATREALTKDIVGRLSVIIPPASLLNEFEQRATVLSDQCHLLDAQNVQLAKARDLLLPKLMNREVAA